LINPALDRHLTDRKQLLFRASRYYHVNCRQISEIKLAKKEEKQEPLLQAVFGIATAILFFRLAASFLPKERLWGFSHAGYLSGFPLIYPALFLVALYLYLRGKKRPVIPSIRDDSKKPVSFLRKLSPILIIVLAVLMFYSLAVDSHFLGDGYSLLSNLSKANPIVKGRAYGEMQAQLLYHKLFSLGDQYDGYRTFRNLSIFAGLIFIISLLYYSRKIFTTRFAYYSFVALNFLSAITILYYGYVETYSLTSAVAFIFFLSGTAALKNRKKSIMPILAFAVAVFLHGINIVYLPSFLFYLIFAFGPVKIKNLLTLKGRQLIFAAAGGFILLYIVVKIWAPPFWQMAFLPVVANLFTLDGYTLFSLKHIIDYANLLIFIVPVALVAFILLRILKEKGTGKGLSFESGFLLMSVISGLLSAFVLEPKLGMARDWDLMSTMLVGTQIAGVYFWIEKYHKNIQFQITTGLVTIICASIFIPWLGLNYSRKGLYDYNMAMLELDPKHGRPGFYAVGELMQSIGVKREAERILRYCDRQFPEVALDKQGAYYYVKRQTSKALNLFDRSIGANPAWFGPYLDKGICLIAMGRPKEAIEALKTADALNPYSPDTYRRMGDAYNMLGDKEQAVIFWNKSLYYGPDDFQIYFALGQYYLEKNMPDSAIYYYTALPDSSYPPEVLYQLGVVAMKKGDKLKATSYFDRYIAIGKDSTTLQNIIILKSQL